MQIELIAPASEDSTLLPHLGLGILAALTPSCDEVIYSDEILRPFEIERDMKAVDLVAITADSKTARRAYQIAHAYRQRGIKVVLGGIHPTAVPDEAAHFADVVVVGEAEDCWPKLLLDFKEGTLKPRYLGGYPELGGRPLPRRDLLASKKYIPFKVVQTTRGCPYACEFCSVSIAQGNQLRHRPIDEVLQELRGLGKLILFADDNVMGHTRYLTELLTRMAELDKHWIGQSSLGGLRNREHIRLLAESGCRALFIGFETVREATLQSVGKLQNRVEDYREIVEALDEQGIATWGSFVFGFDTDDLEAFDRTVEFAIEARLTLASFSILTPYPATRLYRRLAEEHRLVEPRWWLRSHHDQNSPYFLPKLMTREALREGWQRAWKRFYAASSVLHRYRPRWGRGWIQNLGHLPLNLMQQRLVERKILGGQARFLTPSFREPEDEFDRVLEGVASKQEPATLPRMTCQEMGEAET